MARTRSGLVRLVVGASLVLPLCVAGAGRATESRSCAWAAKLDPAGLNVLFPDTAAHYWILQLPAPPGSSLLITGSFPHSRYISYTTYDQLLRSADGLPDVRIAADRGSTNPFLPGASRMGTTRSYRVHVVVGQRAARPADNTVYTTSADGSRSNSQFLVIYRNYREDAGLGQDGGVGLPAVHLVTAAGTVAIPTCPQPTVPPNSVNTTLAEASLPLPYPVSMGTNPPVWRKFYNFPTAAAYASSNQTTGETIGTSAAGITRQTPPGGFADNPDNKYISTVLSSGLGQVALIRAKLPTAPRTFGGATRMGTGQVRYWSMCSNELASGRVYACVLDDEVPVDRFGYFTLMVSTAADRPTNATVGCGIAWLPLGPAVDTVLIERNMLPAGSFRQSIQQARYDHEAADLGRYYPATRYLSRSAAEALGCPRSR